MNLSTAAEWLAWAGIAIPLAALAWSAVTYSVARRREVYHEEYKRFFQITEHLGQQDGSIASKMAAAFELRKYPEYTDVIVRICKETDIGGPAAQMLKDEMKATAEFLKAKK